MSERHPEHERIAETVRGWYSNPHPTMGYLVERRPFGFYMRHATVDFGAATLRNVRPEDAPALLADLRTYYGDYPATIMLDDRQTDATLGPALTAAGCTPRPAQTYLVHVGAVPDVRPVPGVTLEPMTDATAVEWSIAKLKGVANSEEDPGPARLRSEVLLREMELAGVGRFLLARDGREAASIMAWYEGEDRHIFLLATRVPFHDRGIARWLLTQLVADTYAGGCRSIMISCDPDDTPIQLYRRLGFTDEVYWRRAYAMP